MGESPRFHRSPDGGPPNEASKRRGPAFPNVERHGLSAGTWCPNNPDCPLLIYRDALEGSGERLASRFEETFDRNGWPPAWRYTIYDYPHYHSTSHEVIGVFRGEAEVRFGDDAGFTARISAGDAVVIPAGVSHQRLWEAGDFAGVGAYPKGVGEIDEIREESKLAWSTIVGRIRALAVPPDPLRGGEGTLSAAWSRE